MPGRYPEDFAAGLEDCCHFLAYSSKSGGGSGLLVLKVAQRPTARAERLPLTFFYRSDHQTRFAA
jgi:hypothetical protein